MTTKDTALLIHRLGMLPVLIHAGEKRPVEYEWQHRRYTADELEQRYTNNPALGVGLQLGPVSGVVDVELDSPESPADFAELFAGCSIPTTPTYKSRRGEHRLFAWSNELAPIGKAKTMWRTVEVRLGTGDKGAQSLLPPTVTDGFEREWIIPLSDECRPAALPAIVIQRLLEAAKKPEPQPIVKPTNTAVDDFCARAEWAKILEPHGWSYLGESAGLKRWRRPGKSEGISATTGCKSKWDRDLLYVFSTNATPFKHDQSYDKLTAYALLNHTGNTESATKAIISQGYGRALKYERITCAELDRSNYAQDFLIAGTLVARQPCIVAGAKKVLKTSILIDLAISLATGSPFLRKLAVKRKCRVAVMSGESGLATIQETARRIATAAGHSLPSIENLIWSTSLPKFGDAEHLDALDRFLRQDEIETLVIDPAYLALPGSDAGNLMVQGQLLRQMNDVCESTGTGLILAHHTRKNGKAKSEAHQPPELEDISWSGFQEWARQWLLIGRREAYLPGSGEHSLWLNIGGSAGHSALWAVDIVEGVFDPETPRRWEVELSSAEDARSEVKQQKEQSHLSDLQKKLFDAALKYPDGETMRGIRTRAGVNGALVTKAFAELLDAGRVEPCELKKNGRRFSGYKPVVA